MKVDSAHSRVDHLFVGGIPETVGELKSLYLLTLSHNALTGQIPPAIENLKELGSLDLSSNKEQVPLQPAASEDEQSFSRADIYAGATLGFAVGMAIIFLPLLVSRGWRECYNKLVDGLVFWIFSFSKVDVKKGRTNTSIGEIYWKNKSGKSHRQVPSSRR
ncbi:hypothetical protein RND71_000868 [Anisodus tanguticus]|uniref:Uncharacterized protein n=1 Tax=Anisodus tanguticus TaxID=243964 RepID=A0AAE1T079_9SOLA|nr:hypothetical protein RND71_000868 [Anisodus tanguticus]